LVLGRIKGMAAANKYPVELRERAVAMARELERELGPGRGAIARVAARLGVNPEALRYWVRRDEAGHPPAGTAQSAPAGADAQRIAELERENRELRRANEIPRAASAFFARELDPRPPR
jgi:transposase